MSPRASFVPAHAFTLKHTSVSLSHTAKRVMAHRSMHHGTRVIESRHTYELSHGTRMNLRAPFLLGRCGSLQHTAVHCSTLPHTATHCNTLQHTTPYCNTLQHTATQCNTVQHTHPRDPLLPEASFLTNTKIQMSHGTRMNQLLHVSMNHGTRTTASWHTYT